MGFCVVRCLAKGTDRTDDWRSWMVFSTSGDEELSDYFNQMSGSCWKGLSWLWVAGAHHVAVYERLTVCRFVMACS